MFNVFFSFVGKLCLVEIITILANMATTVIAYYALQTWKNQDRAKIKYDFLDNLVETTHTFIQRMSDPIERFKFIKLAVLCHKPLRANDEKNNNNMDAPCIIAYMKKSGESDGKHLSLLLASIQPESARLHALVTKGQVFNFDEYIQCQDAVNVCSRSFDRLAHIASFLSLSSSWNYESPDILQKATDIMNIEVEDVKKSIDDANVILIEFATKAYEKLYR